jgi:hypothetical protein
MEYKSEAFESCSLKLSRYSLLPHKLSLTLMTSSEPQIPQGSINLVINMKASSNHFQLPLIYKLLRLAQPFSTKSAFNLKIGLKSRLIHLKLETSSTKNSSTFISACQRNRAPLPTGNNNPLPDFLRKTHRTNY